MKKIFTTSLLCLFSIIVIGQVNVEPRFYIEDPFPMPFDADELKRVKETTTYFIYGKSEIDNPKVLEQWKQTVRSAWDFSKVRFMSYTDFAKKKNHKGNTYIIKMNRGVIKKKLGTYEELDTLYTFDTYLAFMSFSPEVKVYARVDLQLTPKTAYRLSLERRKDTMDILEYFYDSEDPLFVFKGKDAFYNWEPGLMKMPLALMSNRLSRNAPLNFKKTASPSSELGALRKNTLYMPEYIFIKRGGMGIENISKEDSKSYRNVEKLLKKYKYKAKVVSAESLSKKILNREARYVYLYTMGLGRKFLCLWDTFNNRVLYYDTNGGYLFFSKKDLKKLSKAIEKA